MDIIAELAQTLGSFRAENLGDRLFSLYTQPTYFPELLTPIPCMLMGGRGTGKTTVLKSLSYEGQFRLANQNLDEFSKISYIGLYYKLETGVVSAFSGANKEILYWQGIFSHFINLQLCKQLFDFSIWFEKNSGVEIILDEAEIRTFCASIGISQKMTLKELRDEIDLAIAILEMNVNNAADEGQPKQSPIGGPTRRLVNILRNTELLKAKTFYFLFDEYENLRDYQQTILNTFIKQADSHLTFKIGIRELGLKTRHTLNENEQLVDPADYVLINISGELGEKEFDIFAQSVFEHRFAELKKKGIEILSVAELFEDLSEEAEAIKLGGERIAEEVRKEIQAQASEKHLAHLATFSVQELILLNVLSKGEEERESSIYSLFKHAIADPKKWSNRLNNYGYSSLFTLRRKKVGIKKYYSGWKILLALSANNIRYLLQLVTNSLIEHAKQGNPLTKVISAKCQTEVASEVGKKNLMELEGLSTRGAQLMKLVLGLGQVFHEMAMQPEGHAPEVTQFEIASKQSSGQDDVDQVNELLNAAVMHLALLRTSGTKLGGPGDTRDFDYMLHPIFSAFFVYSHRRKRKFSISSEELLGIVEDPSTTIKSILNRQNRIVTADIPEQLRLFGGFYEGNS